MLALEKIINKFNFSILTGFRFQKTKRNIYKEEIDIMLIAIHWKYIKNRKIVRRIVQIISYK